MTKTQTKPLDADDIATNASRQAPLEQVVAKGLQNNTLSRRSFLQLGTLSLGVLPLKACASTKSIAIPFKNPSADVLIAWGDSYVPGVAPFIAGHYFEDHYTNTFDTHFGYNADFTAFLPRGSQDGVLCVNHEYVNPPLMFPTESPLSAREQLMVQQKSVGMTTLHIVEKQFRSGSYWALNEDRAVYNFGLNAFDTVYHLTGPAAGSPRLQTKQDPTGTIVTGMVGNCSGGTTPWGTVLTCEENFDQFFFGKTDQEKRNYQRYGVGNNDKFGWGKEDPRFNLAVNPNEANKYGWVVEINPHDSTSIPKKRTALGRMKHEAACCVEAEDGRVVVYTGDDQYFEYFYKYVSDKPWRSNEDSVLDEGTLYAAEFLSDGTVKWLPLVYGQGPLTPENDFYSQADVLIETRHAASLVGSTPMDRPEGISKHPQTGDVFFACTKNNKRRKTNAANPRPFNRFGHIIRLIGEDHTALRTRWDIFLLGDNPNTTPGSIPCPDNVAFSPDGTLYVTNDGADKELGESNALYRVAPDGFATKIYEAPLGAELTGPSFTPNGKTMFLSVQHPGSGSSYENPSTRWPQLGPDFREDMPPRPGVIALKL